MITLNRPDNRNSMTEEILEGMSARAREARDDRDLRCLVITGRGRSFCAGADFRAQIQRDDEGRTPHERSYAMYEPFLSLLDVEVPIVGAINGHAIGGGFGLALMCDLRYVREDAKYGANFTRLGLHPGMAVSYLLPRLVGLPRASEWLYTGRLFDGREGAAAGLFNEALPGDAVEAHAMGVARTIASNAPIAMRIDQAFPARGARVGRARSGPSRGVCAGGERRHGRREGGHARAAREARPRVHGSMISAGPLAPSPASPPAWPGALAVSSSRAPGAPW